MAGGAKLVTVTAAAVRGVPPTTSNNLPILPSSSSSNSRVPVSGNYTSSLRRHSVNCSCSAGVCRCEYVGVRQGEKGNEPFVNRVFGQVPSRFEVENAIAALQSLLHGISSSGSESKYQIIMETQRYRRIYEAFRLLQTDSNVLRMVMSLSSDQAVWDAILNNKMVRRLLNSPPRRSVAEDESLKSSSEEPEPDWGALILRWILEITKEKIMELVEKFQSLVNEVFQSSGREGSNPETTEQLDERIVSSTFLAIVIVLIVVFARSQCA